MNRTRLLLAAAAFAVAAAVVYPCPFALAGQPPAPKPKPTPPVAKVDPAALALLKKAENAIFALKTYQADCIITNTTKPVGKSKEPPFVSYETATLIAAKPNISRFAMWSFTDLTKEQLAQSDWWKKQRTDQTIQLTLISDGNTEWDQENNLYYRTRNLFGQRLPATTMEAWEGFFDRTFSPLGLTMVGIDDAPWEVRKEGTAFVNGVLCDKVFTRTSVNDKNNTYNESVTWYIGRADGLVRRKTKHQISAYPTRSDFTKDTVVFNLRANAPITDARKTFSYSPPQGMQEVTGPELNNLPALVKGAPAPDFTAFDKNNRPVKLSDFKGKVVVVDFWGVLCAPCVAAMPHNQNVIQKLQKQGVSVVFLAVDDSEERAGFLAWMKKNQSAYSSLQFIHTDPKTLLSSKEYRAKGFPAQFIIDGDGVLRTTIIGYDGPNNALEKAIRSAALPK